MFEGLPRPPEGADCAETSTDVSGRASCARAHAIVPESARTKRKVGKSGKNWQHIMYGCVFYSSSAYCGLRAVPNNLKKNTLRDSLACHKITICDISVLTKKAEKRRVP